MSWFPFRFFGNTVSRSVAGTTQPAEAALAEDAFKAYPNYEGSDLGLTYSSKKSVFKIWSPPASEARLMIYEKGLGGDPISTYRMKKGKNGVWSAKVKGNLEGKYYTFQVRVNNTWLAESPDPYAKAVGVNGKRGQVVDMKKTNPEGWEADKRPAQKSYADIILYELHLRDLSVHTSSGIKNKGKFLGLAQTGTKSPDGLSTGLDHLKELGITHVHLLPSFDFMSVDETTLDKNNFNWGYDPQNYNVPEGSYSTDPYDGKVRIREFKQMVKTLHDNGIRVIMDVVYNHTGATQESVFNQFVPRYYYRQDEKGGFSNASACGNEVASERYMVRKFIVESMLYWAKEYHVDGFRVDLMGIHDIETMNQTMRELRKIDPTIFMYGEGWTAGGSPLDEKDRAIKINTLKLDGIAAFSDEFRDAVKGYVFDAKAKGFVSGEKGLEESVKFGMVGAIQHPGVNNEKVNYSNAAWANLPTQCINYVSCHDNHTLWDRLKNSCPAASEADLLRMNKLAQTMVLTSQGVPFLHAGEEFVRTKFGVENSFNSPDNINQINWENKKKHHDLFEYYKSLIELRKQHPAFRMNDPALIRQHLEFLPYPIDNVLGYMLKDNANGDSWKRILLIFNGNDVEKSVTIPPGKWTVICQEGKIATNGMGAKTDTNAVLQPNSAYILAEKE
jgi:pullulanase